MFTLRVVKVPEANDIGATAIRRQQRVTVVAPVEAAELVLVRALFQYILRLLDALVIDFNELF